LQGRSVPFCSWLANIGELNSVALHLMNPNESYAALTRSLAASQSITDRIL